MCRSRRERSGFTLIEVSMALAITAMLSLILAGLVSAVQTAHAHTRGLEDATLQAQAAIDRIRYMVAHAGAYRVAGGATVSGIAVVNHKWTVYNLPDVLVVWSGGREGGMAAAGEQSRLPRANELIVFAPDPADPSRLLEYAFPKSTAEVDFQSGGVANQILGLIASPQAGGVLLCDQVRQSQLPQLAWYPAVQAPNIRFELVRTPSDAQLAATTPGTAQWNALPWAQGIAAGDSGLRQTTLRIELIVEERERLSAGATSSAGVPFFGSASQRHVYRR